MNGILDRNAHFCKKENSLVNIVKIGGNVIDNPEKLNAFLKSFASISGSKILIHGGGKIEAFSAGSNPSGKINPKAIEAMHEIGYDLTLCFLCALL